MFEVNYEVVPTVVEALPACNPPKEMCEACAFSIRQHGHAVCGCTLYLPKVNC